MQRSRVYITHVTEEYLEIAKNLAVSINKFSKIQLIIYCINFKPIDGFFNDLPNVESRFIELDSLMESNGDEYTLNVDGNLYVNRNNDRIYQILCAKTLAMESALNEFDEVCYLDSDCIATPIVDELFEWIYLVEDYPLATRGVHDFLIIAENGIERGNPFEDHWPTPNIKLSLEWPLMKILDVPENKRGVYRTTNVLIMNKKCISFIKLWKDVCYILPRLLDTWKFAPFHEETIFNTLVWKKTNIGLPLCYINIGEGIETVKHFYSTEVDIDTSSWEETSRVFYKIPANKRDIKVLHGEKRKIEVDKILEFVNTLITSI